MQPMINPPEVRKYFTAEFTREGLTLKSAAQLKLMHNEAWDYCLHEDIPLGGLKRRRKWESFDEAVECTWKMLGIMNGDIDMADEATKPEAAPRPRPKCYAPETVKRPTRKMFMRIKKVGEPDKSQRPFAWGQFKDGMRLVDIKEDPDLHAGKISFWMRQTPPLIELVDITDEEFEKELAKWYTDHGLENPTAGKAKAKADRAAAKAARDAERAAKAEEREKSKAAKSAEREAKEAERAKAKEAKAQAAAAAKEAAPATKKKPAAAA